MEPEHPSSAAQAPEEQPADGPPRPDGKRQKVRRHDAMSVLPSGKYAMVYQGLSHFLIDELGLSIFINTYHIFFDRSLNIIKLSGPLSIML